MKIVKITAENINQYKHDLNVKEQWLIQNKEKYDLYFVWNEVGNHAIAYCEYCPVDKVYFAHEPRVLDVESPNLMECLLLIYWNMGEYEFMENYYTLPEFAPYCEQIGIKIAGKKKGWITAALVAYFNKNFKQAATYKRRN